ncbi:MAG TPA: late competence protein ComER [Bacillales bacterium]|nr:late competence protein ComER [Bacillales bacterium]
MKIGIIGTGNMGNILIQALITSSAAHPSQLVITNRTKQKADKLKETFPELHVADSPKETANTADILFICVKPLDIHPLLKKISGHLSREKMLVSITSPVSVEELESMVDCSVARAIPSITNRALAGASLITFGASCTEDEKNQLLSLMEQISAPYEIEENITRVASDIVSCGPAFFTYLTERFIESAVSETEISHEEATHFASEMLIGLGKLLEKEIFTLPELREKVHVKGGVTGEGLSVLENEVGEMFNHLYQKTHKKYDDDRSHVKKQFNL